MDCKKKMGLQKKSVNTPVVIYFTNKILNSISKGIFLLVLPNRFTLHIILKQSPQCSSVKSSTPNIKWAMWEMQQNYWDYYLTKCNSCVSSWWWPWHWDDISFYPVNSEGSATHICCKLTSNSMMLLPHLTKKYGNPWIEPVSITTK
jgi:hypothetical protein